MTYSPIRVVSIAVLFFLLIGCSAFPWANQTREDTGYLTPASEQTLATTPTPTPVPPTTLLTLSPADRIAIYSTVAHYHFDPSNKILGDQRWPVIFVGPNLATNLDPSAQHWDGDPTPPELLPQLHDLAPRVEFATLQAVIQRDRMNAVREDGIWLGFGSIQVKESEVQVEVESFINGLNAVGYAYRLVRQGDRWVVLQASLRWIS